MLSRFLFKKEKRKKREREGDRECAFHLQNPGDVAGSSTTVRKFNYFLPGGIRQRSAINKHTTELVYTTVTYTEKQRASRSSHHVCTHTHTHSISMHTKESGQIKHREVRLNEEEIWFKTGFRWNMRFTQRRLMINYFPPGYKWSTVQSDWKQLHLCIDVEKRSIQLRPHRYPASAAASHPQTGFTFITNRCSDLKPLKQ